MFSMNKLTTEDRVRVVRCLVDGCSMGATARLAGVARNTVDKLLVELGATCSEYQDRIFRDLRCQRIQVDECWQFCYCKEKNVTPEIVEKQVAGDVWTWAAIDADTKLIPCWCLGKRDAATASEFIGDLSRRMANRIELTSDGLKVYLCAIIDAFADNIDYVILHKIYGVDKLDATRYSPATCVGCDQVRVLGGPDPRYISTSYIERANLTMRMGMRRFTRLTNGFSKKIENHAAAVALHMMHYNFGRKHQTLGTAPAVQAGITDHIWSVEEIIALLDSK
jgi:IS1 family transposase